MSVTVSASDVGQDFGAFHERALQEPVRVTGNGGDTVYIISESTFRALKQGQRQALAASELSDDEANSIAAAEIPPEHRYSLTDI